MLCCSQRPDVPRAVAWTANLFLAALLFTPAPAGAASREPAGKTYFMVTRGLFTEHEVDVMCLRFTPRRLCFEGGPCGTWAPLLEGTDTSTLVFEVSHVNSGIDTEIEGELSLDTRGEGSALGGSGRIKYLDAEINFSLAGRVAGRRECRRLAAELQGGVAAFDAAQCERRARFGEPTLSPYVLPYEVGSRFEVSQSYCVPSGSHRSKFAYDFALPFGTPVVAAREGVVWWVEDGFEDGNPFDVNLVMIEHEDGTIAYYAHLQHQGSVVAVGDRVVAGQLIGWSGDSGDGAGWAHLHFQVQRDRDLFDGNALPVNFRNAEGPLDERGGLQHGVSYRALPW